MEQRLIVEPLPMVFVEVDVDMFPQDYRGLPYTLLYGPVEITEGCTTLGEIEDKCRALGNSLIAQTRQPQYEDQYTAMGLGGVIDGNTDI